MTTTEWVEVAAFGLTIVGIFVRMERRMGKALTREEHEAICKDRNLQVEKKIDSLRADMERRHEENRDTFEKIETGITGTHRRLDDLYRDLIGRGGQR